MFLYPEKSGTLEEEDEMVICFSPDANAPYANEPVDVINLLLEGLEKSAYLEIGVDTGSTFEKVCATTKHGIDPYGTSDAITHKITSQMFFAMNSYFWHNTYDFIFIDGCHMAPIIAQDIGNALQILNPGGYIMLHDTAPVKKIAQRILLTDYERFIKEVVAGESPYNVSGGAIRAGDGWIGYNGDAWKAVASIRMRPHEGLIYTIPEACVTLINPTLTTATPRPAPPVVSFADLTWEYYLEHWDEILNPMQFGPFEGVCAEMFAIKGIRENLTHAFAAPEV